MVGKLTPNDIATASTVATIMGFNPWSTPNDALAKAIAAAEGRPDDWQGNEATGWGDRLEPIIINLAAERLALTHVKTEFNEAFFHRSAPLACSLDGEARGSGFVSTDTERGIYALNAPKIAITGPGIIESKVTSALPEMEPPPHRGPLQLQAQMACTGHAWGVVATLYRGIELRLYVYASDPAVQQRIIDASVEFKQRVTDCDFYPPISSADADTAYSRVDDGAPSVDLSVLEGGNDYLAMLVTGKQRKRDAEDMIEEAERNLKEIMGCHEQAHGLADNAAYKVIWGERKYSAQPQKIVEAKPARTVRSKTLTLKGLD
jgi:predicted phage-related endonuclease